MRFTLIALLCSPLPCIIAQQQNPTATPNSQPNVFFGDKEKKVKGSTRPVHGTVKDNSGSAIPRAIVALKNLKTGKKIETVTREDGSYRFDELKIDEDYELQATHEKLSSPPRKLSLYDSRRDPVINFELAPNISVPNKDVQPQAKQ